MKRLCLSIVLAAVATLLVVVPVLAAYYAYIYIEEMNGKSYDQLPVICPTNITLLAQSHFISSTGLDTRVITGSGEVLPHMLANDKILFTTPLSAYEDKTLIFYLGASSLSSFPIIVGYGGNITTPDDPDLEFTYVMEILASGYFDASAGSDKNILYKEDAFKMNISAANTLRVAALGAGDAEQWEMHYSSFTTGKHTVYILANGLGAYLYVDDFDVAEDTVNLFESNNAVIDSSPYASLYPNQRHTVYAEGKYWAFYGQGDTDLHYKTSSDGLSWSSEYTVAGDGNNLNFIDARLRDGYLYVAYSEATTDTVQFRRGVLNADNSITWSAAWQTATGAEIGTLNLLPCSIGVDNNGYPFVLYRAFSPTYAHTTWVSKSSTNDGTWSTAGGYPLKLVDLQSGFFGEYGISLVTYLSSGELYILCQKGSTLSGRYYNGSAWSGSWTTIASEKVAYCGGVADADGNLYIVWQGASGIYLKIRYASGLYSSIIPISATGSSPCVSYNDDIGYVYITYIRNNAVRCVTLSEDTLTGEYTLFSPSPAISSMSVIDYSDYIGILYNTASDLQHGFLQFPYDWNDNLNNWTWMQNNVMPYASLFQLGIDGILQLEYMPTTIIQGTTLPDGEGNHDGTISWGTNPDGVVVSISGLQGEEREDSGYYYQSINPDSQDVIKPEPASTTTDVDTAGLTHNPLYPLVQIISSVAGFTERLAWLGLAWLIVIGAMLGVHLGFDTKKDTEKPQHFVLTTITGLGLSIMFYTMAIFPLWVVILMVFGLVGAIIWERQPVM